MNSMDHWFFSPGIVTTVVLTLVVLGAAALILIAQVNKYLEKMQKQTNAKDKLAFSEQLINLESEVVAQVLEARRKALHLRIIGKELSTALKPMDQRGLVSKLSPHPERPFCSEKKADGKVLHTPPALTRLMMAYLVGAPFWLVFG